MSPRAHPAVVAWFAPAGMLGALTTIGACRTTATPSLPSETNAPGGTGGVQENIPERIAEATANLLRKEPTGTAQGPIFGPSMGVHQPRRLFSKKVSKRPAPPSSYRRSMVGRLK